MFGAKLVVLKDNSKNIKTAFPGWPSHGKKQGIPTTGKKPGISIYKRENRIF